MHHFLEKINSIVFGSQSRLIELAEKELMLVAQLLAINNHKEIHLENLQSVEFQAFSQWGEDGIIDWLVHKCLAEASFPKTFVEFGVQDYHESNTRYLLKSRNWRGLVIDGSSDNIAQIQKQNIYWKYDVRAEYEFIDCNNINKIISSSGFKGDIGLLSIDIDGNDYWVWEAIDVVSPKIVICEYNALLGDIHELVVPYTPDFNRTTANFSNLYFGSSIRALINLGKRNKYEFIGTNSSGVNAFFIHSSIAHFVLPNIKKILAFPSKFREARNSLGELTFVSGFDRINSIKSELFYDLSSDTLIPLGSLNQIYSREWQNGDPCLIN